MSAIGKILLIRSLFLPMLDSFRFTSDNYEINYNSEFNDPIVKVKSNVNFKKQSEVKINPKSSGDSLLIYYGISLDNNNHDCLSLSLTFSERKDDKLVSERSAYFGKYFLYDRNHFDLIEECVYPNNPFIKRILFYYYVLMLDQLDFEKEEPRRTDLEKDKIIVNFIKENLLALEGLEKTTIEEEQKRMASETNPFLKNAINYKINQRKLLKILISKYEDQVNFLVKDEVL